MSADLFAVFGTPDEAPSREQLDERWTLPPESPDSGAKQQSLQTFLIKGDVFFDAEAEAADDFGDFEGVDATRLQETNSTLVQKPISSAPSVPAVDEQFSLLDLGDEPVPDVEQQRRKFPSLETTSKIATTDDADDWGEFVDSPLERQHEQKQVLQPCSPHALASIAVIESTQQVSNLKTEGWDDFEDWTTEVVEVNIKTSTLPRLELPDEPRPANIPPPTILLQLLPDVFQSIQDLARVAQDDTEINEIAASIVTVFAVSARIIAGRSLRWKRDTYLAQSTRIGPSVSGARSGGMKLTAVNKSEAVREEREAADVCDAWSRNTHVFASVVTRSEHTRPWMNLNIKMTPRPSPGFGTLEARDPCGLCGIKRDERIAGVDFDVDDVFNEYWTEHWGHTDCKVFWYTYKDMLNQRG